MKNGLFAKLEEKEHICEATTIQVLHVLANMCGWLHITVSSVVSPPSTTPTTRPRSSARGLLRPGAALATVRWL